jgi:hypothetical protein
VVTRVYRWRLWRLRVVATLAASVMFGLAAVLAWWGPSWWRLPRLGWQGTEQAGWIAGILGAVFALISFVFDRVDSHRETQPRLAASGGLVQVGRVPQQAAWFQDRHARIDLATAAKAGRAAVLSQVLSGMGGVGKTQLAAQFARQLTSQGELDVLVWVTASSRDAIMAAYAETARAVGLADADVTLESAAGRLLGWLEHTDRRWLIVLDDLDTPAEASLWWPPNSMNGRTVVTTRRRDAVFHTDRRTLIEVDLFTPEEAVNYLNRAAGKPAPRADLHALAGTLGHLPIAVAQAAAFMRDRNLDCTAYLQRLSNHRNTLADSLPTTDALPDDHRSTVAATWSLSLEAADDSAPRGVARPVLSIAALLDPNAIPSELFTTEPVMNYLTTHRTTGDCGPVDEQSVEDALHVLHRLNLTTYDPNNATLRIHAMVQRATRDHLTGDQLTTAAYSAADALLAIWPTVERDPAIGQMLRASTIALQQHSGDGLFTPDVHQVMFRALRSLGDTGQAHAAVTAHEQLSVDCQRVLGPDHPDTLAARHHLANWRGEASDSTGAIAAYERLLPDQLRVLGPDHPETLTSRHNLSYWRGKAGDSAGAATALERLLTDQLRVLGPDHPQTLISRHNLARWRGEAGNPGGAVSALKRLLIDQLRVFGPDHPETLSTRHNIARWRGEAGDPAGAATAYEDLLTDRLRILGPNHPHTFNVRSNLAMWRGKAGDPAGAANAFQQLLADRLRVLGADHPATLNTRSDLALWQGKAGDHAGAVTALEQVVSEFLRVLGPDHPDTLNARGYLAALRVEAGDPAAAVTIYQELLTDQLRVLGPDHPQTLITHDLFARWKRSINDKSP